MPEQPEPIKLHCVVEIQKWAFDTLDKEAFKKAIVHELTMTMIDMKLAFLDKYDELKASREESS